MANTTAPADDIDDVDRAEIAQAMLEFDAAYEHLKETLGLPLEPPEPEHPIEPPVIEPPPVVEPPVEPEPLPPEPEPAPPGMRMVNGRAVPLNLFGFSVHAKVDDVNKVLASIERVETGLYTSGHRARAIGIFLGLSDPRNLTPGYSVPAALFKKLREQNRWVVIGYPTVFQTDTSAAKFANVIAGKDDNNHRTFAKWAKDSGAHFILRLGWERPADWMPHCISDKAGRKFDHGQVVASQHHVMDVLEDAAPGLFLYSDSSFRVPFSGNGAGKAPTIIDPALVALDARRVHMAGADIYPGGWNMAKQTLDQWFDYQETITSAGKVVKIPASLMAWARWAHARGLPLCVDEWGTMGRQLPQFVNGMASHVLTALKAEGIDISSCMYFHMDNSKLVGVAGMESCLAAFRSTFGSR